jgi:hypothetical protein
MFCFFWTAALFAALVFGTGHFGERKTKAAESAAV